MKGNNTLGGRTCDNECAENILCTLAPCTVLENKTSIIDLPINNDHPLLQPFTLAELNNALKSCANTSPGQDSITYDMLFNLPDSGKLFLIDIFSNIFFSGEEVKDLKIVKIVPILKPGKKANISSSYRPISLMSCILKTLERIIKHRLEWWLEFNKLNASYQYGYKRNLSTQHAAGKLITDIQLAHSRNNYLGVIFLDIEGAYNNVNLNTLESKLMEFDIPIPICRNLVRLYRSRQIYLRHQDNTLLGPRLVDQGLPQGSVLSPMLFNIYTSDMENESFRTIQYADDFALYFEDPKLENCLNKLNLIMETIEVWTTKKHFTISPTKTYATIFTRHNIPNYENLQLSSYVIPYKKEIKYLGITMDQKLTWKSHISNLIAKAEKSLNLLRLTTRRYWGADITTSLLMYRATIRSIIDYGCIFYGAASDSLLKRVDILQNKALRICAGVMRSTPVEALRVETGEPPLKLRREYLSKKFIMKLKASQQEQFMENINNLTRHDLMNQYWRKKNSPPLTSAFTKTAKFDNRIMITPVTLGWLDLASLFSQVSVIFPNFSDNNRTINKFILLEQLNNFEDFTKIYTDGSKSSVGTGCAFFIPLLEIQERINLPKEASIFSAEACAILEALLSISSNNIKKCLILSDSMSVLKSLSNINKITSPIIMNIIKIYHELQKMGYNIHFMWIKAHAGLVYNEKVDLLAKEACTDYNKRLNEIPVSDFIPIFKKELMANWANIYSNAYKEKPTNYSLIHPSIPSHQWYHNVAVPRKMYTVITRLKFNHGRFPHHLHKIKIINSNLCSCGRVGDINHIFFECTLFSAKRKQLIEKLLRLKVQLPMNMNYILCSENLFVFHAIFEFVNSAGIVI